MKTTILVFLLLLFAAPAFTQAHRLEKIWETDTLLKVPESVLQDNKNKWLYVSNIDGLDPWGKDGKGSIGKVGLDGKIIAVDWVKGLNAPKGMALYKNTLYVADLNELVLIDVEKAEIKKRVVVPTAERLNDVTVDGRGTVYVSDSKANRVFVYKDNTASPHLEGLQQVNGVLWFNDNLYVLDKGTLFRVEYDRKLTKIASGMEGGTDGVEAYSTKEFIVSGWAGVIYFVYPDGTKETLLDTRKDKINSADITYDAVSRIVYVPTFWKNSVVAYELK